MQSIQANNYPIHFNEKAYEALNQHLKENKYSNLFVIVDSNTNEFCLTKFLPYLETELNIEIIEFEKPIEIDIKGFEAERIKIWFPEPYYKIVGNKAIAIYINWQDCIDAG